MGDGSGKIEYTEFCAAGVGKEILMRVEALWAAFKTFDIDNDGNVSKDEVERILRKLGLDGAMAKEQYQNVITAIVSAFDRDGNNVLDFDEWVQMVHANVCGTPMAECDLTHDVGARSDQQPQGKPVSQAYAKFSVR